MKSQKSLKDIKISLVGAHTKSLDEALQKRNYNTNLLPTTHFPSFKRIKGSEIVVGSYFQSSWPWFVAAKLKRKKTICHWIGSDTVLSVKNWRRKLQTRIFSKFIDKHIAVSERIKIELDEMGIESTVLFHGSDTEPEEIELPKSFGVLVYFIEGREKLYGLDRIIEISEKLLDVEFYFIGHFDSSKYTNIYSQKNLHFLGFVDMNQIWEKISVIVRMTEHDGFPKIIIEAYSKGRYVIHNYPLPGVILCQTNREVIEEISNLKRTNIINKEGITLFEEQFHYNIFLERFENICLSLLND